MSRPACVVVAGQKKLAILDLNILDERPKRGASPESDRDVTASIPTGNGPAGITWALRPGRGNLPPL